MLSVFTLTSNQLILLSWVMEPKVTPRNRSTVRQTNTVSSGDTDQISS